MSVLVASLLVIASLFVFPRGREQAVRDLIGGSEPIEGCRWTGAQIERYEAIAQYACPSGTLRAHLRHPDAAGNASFRTARFAVAIEPENADSARFAQVLESRIRARGSTWQWTTARFSDARPPDVERVLPWRWIAGFIGLGALAVWRARRASTDTLRVTLPALAGLVVATCVLRRLAVPPAWFHQNGQGPQWLAGLDAPSTWYYGPGFGEVFQPVHWFAASNPIPALFLQQGLLSAAAVAALWISVRLTGAARPIAWAMAFVAAVEPSLVRASGSESYFATTHALVALASATLALGAEMDEAPFQFMGALCAACLAGEAMRVHPYAFAAAPAVAAVLLAHRRARSLGRARVAALAATFLLALLALESFGAYQRMRNPAVAHWGSHIGAPVARVHLAGGLALILVTAFAAWKRGRGAAFVALGAAYLAVAWQFHLQLAHVHPSIDAAYAAMLATPVVPLFARAASDLAPAAVVSRLAALIVGFACIHLAIMWRPVTTLPTDGLEVNVVERWRRTLPDGSSVLYLSRAGNHTTVMPVRDGTRVGAFALNAEPAPVPADLDATHYVHSSICSTGSGSRACDALEASLRLDEIARETLPARPSQYDLPYDRGAVPIILYRVLGTR